MTHTELVQDGLATLDEAMTFLAIGRTKLYELMDTGQIPFSKMGRCRRIPRRALIEFAQLTLRGGQLNTTIGSGTSISLV